ncbi:oligosaccharide flippase family protein [Oribacterium sp. NK2B42]|uniref:oligosaccharide flippase family protein n=1 Tax=Oribacterium sp. NK2B42 TaxID=689781 RepID=UPI000404D435|nr:polysaccharide biosynthesis C-terminal domain-containing protein [Oribacterium sp. NK2B42]
MIKKLVNNAYVFSVIAKAFSVLSGIIYSILYSRYLGAELRGTASIINNYADILSIVLCLGAFQAYPYFKQRDKKDIYESFINNVFGLLISYFILLVPILILIPLNINLVVALLIAPIWMASRQLNYVVVVENPRLSNIGSMILDLSDLLTLALLMIFTKVDFKWCIVVVTLKQIIYLLICIKNICFRKFRFRPTLKGIMPYIRYGIVPMITIILMEVNYKIDVLMLEWFRVSNATIGIYSLGVMLAQKVWMIPDALKDILLSKLVGGKGAEEVAKVSRISFFITMICEILVIIFGKPLIRVLYGSEYDSAYFITLIICAGVIGMVFYKMIYSFNVANGDKNVNLFLLGISALANIILNALTIPLLGSYGAAIASLVSYFVCGIGFLIFFSRKTGTKIWDIVVINKDDFVVLKQKLIK